MASEQETSGIVIRGSDGEIYFLRQEVLDACRVTEPEMLEFIEETAKQAFKDDPKRFTVKLGSIDKAIPIQGPLAPSKFDAKAASTVMCPGSMKSSAIKVNVIKEEF